tara:strand:- start:2612 stop:2824 length:213 start_codon:yes stop_codon:yes gene_type:complete
MNQQNISKNCLCSECGIKSLEVKSVPSFQIKGKIYYTQYCPSCLDSATDGTGTFGEFYYWNSQVEAWCLV